MTRKPSILFLNRVYPPDVAATGQLLADLATHLAREQFNVSVLTTLTAPAPRQECLDGVNVRRAKTLVFSRAAHWKRALCYLSIYPAFLREGIFRGRPDIIVTMTDPPLHLALGPFLKWRHRCLWVHWAQDIYPDIAIELGVIPRRGPLTGSLRSVANWALHQSDKVVAVGRCMKTRLEASGLASPLIEVIPNWSLNAARNPALTAKIFREQHQLTGKFVVMYSGNFGLAHSFGALENAVRELESKLPRVQFVFIGDGPALPAFKEKLKGCANVLFLPFRSQNDLAASLEAADLHIATMLEGLCGLVVPSKLYGVLAAGRPCLFIGPAQSEAARVIVDSRSGLVITPNEGAKLIAALEQLVNSPDTLAEMAGNAAALAPELSVETASQRFAQLFRQILGERV